MRGGRWRLEGILNFVPNVARLFLTSGLWRGYVFGAYMPPNNAPAVHRVEQEL